jgi:threonine dehydrogenase-like Zn-dependent dehydrogenase
VRRLGKLLLLGDTGTPGEQRLTSDVMTMGITIISAHDSNPPQEAQDRDWWTKPHMAELFFTYLQRGQMDVESLITHRYSPADAKEAYAMLTTKRAEAMGVIFDWTKLDSAQ